MRGGIKQDSFFSSETLLAGGNENLAPEACESPSPTMQLKYKC